jgi:ketosteroid isomerase-like protein
MKTSALVEIALEFIECINRQDLAKLTGLMTEDHTFVDSAGDAQASRSLMTQGWRDYFDANPRYLIHVCEVFVHEPRVVVVGRTTRSHVGLPRAVEIQETLIWEAEIDGDLVQRWQIFDDSVLVRKRLGADASSLYTKPTTA